MMFVVLCGGAFAQAAEPIVIVAKTRAEEALPAARGVCNVQVFRASRVWPEETDGKGWTYHHHVDMACWKGKLYVAWDSCEKDEDVWPSRELYASSTDGMEWTKPAELFPQGTSTAARMYFFCAPNGRMLTVAGFRGSTDVTTERKKGAMVVREIRGDHSLGDVFTLKPPGELQDSDPAIYSKCGDAGFVEACNQLLANVPFLEQADYGLCASERKMKWHDSSTWPADEPSREHFANRFGKAMAFYHRKDGALVAVMKWGWVLISKDEGKTWSSPTRPATLVAGMAKMWGQRTADDRYALLYNPDLLKRYPLVMVSGDDGITFGDMRIVQGELPPMRYPGLYKDIGPQYVRGISEWSTDGSRKDLDGDAMWVGYSMSKEDIWVSRIPLGAAAKAWSFYSPRWASARMDGETVTMEDRDPSDYAKAVRTIDPPAREKISFEVRLSGEPLIVELAGKGVHRIDAHADWHRVEVPAAGADSVSFRTGERVAITSPQQDRPVKPSRAEIRNFTAE